MLDPSVDIKDKDTKGQRYLALIGKSKKVYFSSISFLCSSRADENKVIFYLSENITNAEVFNTAKQTKELTQLLIKNIYPDMTVSFLNLEEDE